jgi:hypothetical protein
MQAPNIIKRRFTKQDAEAMVGRAVRSLVDISCVPAGTRGRVVAAEEAGNGYDLSVEWESSHLPTDWFSQDQFERYLVEA